MQRLSRTELDARCQKLDSHRLGNWMARNITRPMATRVTEIVSPWGFGANAMTICAWLFALTSAAAFAIGGVWSWIVGAVLLQVFYLLDHVDGQLARLRRTESLDGVSLDYLMHHLVNLAVPLGIGQGLFAATLEPWWLLAGTVWGMALLVGGLVHDVRYKAFVQRLKRVRGDLILRGGGGGRPEPAALPHRGFRNMATWLAAKLCEMHVIMNLLALAALIGLMFDDHRLMAARSLTLILASCAIARSSRALLRLLSEQPAEREFVQWFRPPAGCGIVYEAGWWCVELDVPTKAEIPPAVPIEC